MLLYTEGSFFQVLEGESEKVGSLLEIIKRDERHTKVTVIIREPIAKRSFGDWTMGYADITPQEADTIVGANDFFGKGESFAQLSQGRAKKLLAAFKQGRWRTRLTNTDFSATQTGRPSGPSVYPGFSYAFQPIINASTHEVFSYEA